MLDQLAVKFGSADLKARRLAIEDGEDEIEACYDRGWSDGLPLVPPTELRVVKMLQGTRRVWVLVFFYPREERLCVDYIDWGRAAQSGESRVVEWN